MPYTEVFKKFAKGSLHSGSKTGKKVTDKKQATAIYMSEKKQAEGGKKEYQKKKKKKGISTGPSDKVTKKFNFSNK